MNTPCVTVAVYAVTLQVRSLWIVNVLGFLGMCNFV
jgi:hypothetical protein